MSDHHLLDHEYSLTQAVAHTPRGPGFDRRHIITIDGKGYKAGPRETAIIAQRMTAKRHAANWFWCLLELGTMALFFAAGALWMVLAHG